MPKESLNQPTESGKDEDEQLEIVLQYWLKQKKNMVVEEFDTLRKDLENLKQEDYRVTRRGQMHVRHLRKVANKILGLKFPNADLQKYLIRKIQNLCKNVLRDCCIELEVSAYDVEGAASSTNHAQYLIHSIENHCPLPPEIKEKYQKVCSLFEESAITNFLSIVPYLVQNIKDIFVDDRMTEVPQNGLRGLPGEKLDEFGTSVQSAEKNDEFFKLLSDFSRILELLCLENYDKEPNAEIEKWGESLAVLPMLNYLKPYFQHCSQDVRLHKRLELFSRCLRETIDNRDYFDEFVVHDLSNVLSSLIHFAKIDPSKEVRFELNGSTDLPCSCDPEKVKYDKLENTYSQVFRIKRDPEDELQLHAAARVYKEGEICRKGTFQATIVLTPQGENALINNCHITDFHEITATKLEDRQSGNICVIFCSSRKEKLLELLDVLRKGLRENEVDLSKSKVTQCPLWMRSHVTSKADARLSLRLVYKWGSEAVVLDSKDFVAFASSSHGQWEGDCNSMPPTSTHVVFQTVNGTTVLGWNEEPILFDKQICFAGDNQLEEENSVRESNVNVPSGHMQIFIKTMEERIITIAVNPSDCIWNVKTVIHKLYHCPPNSQRLVFDGMRLEDERSLRDCNIKNGSYLYLVQRLRNVDVMPV